MEDEGENREELTMAGAKSVCGCEDKLKMIRLVCNEVWYGTTGNSPFMKKAEMQKQIKNYLFKEGH